MSALWCMPKLPPEENVKVVFTAIEEGSLQQETNAGMSTLQSVLNNENATLEKTIEEMKEKICNEEKDVMCLRVEHERRQEECKILKSQCKELKKNMQKIQKEKNELLESPLTESDHQKIDTAKIKFVLYEQCSGVVFDYSVKEKVEGFVQNSAKKYMSTFSLEKDSNIEKALWNEVKKAGSLSCSQHPDN